MIELYNYLNERFFFFRYIFLYELELCQLVLIIVWLLLIRKYHVSGRVSALIAFFLLMIAMIFNLLRYDDIAGLIAQFVFIFFTFAFFQELIHFMKHEHI